MYPTDRRQLNTERQIYLDKQFVVDVFQSLLAFEILMEILSATMKNSLKSL